jgi:hypothetical protein
MNTLLLALGASLSTANMVLVIALVGFIVTWFILSQRGHNNLLIVALLCWPLALFISLCIPVKTKQVVAPPPPSPQAAAAKPESMQVTCPPPASPEAVTARPESLPPWKNKNEVITVAVVGGCLAILITTVACCHGVNG